MASAEDSESLAERQENELQVLQAIYVDDVEDRRENDAWKVARPPEIRLTLKPQESMTNQEMYTSIDMFIKYPVNYPEVVPDIKLSNPKGLSNQHVTALQSEINVMAKRLVGEVMILELAQYVQKYLHAHNKPPKKSFYDEMMSNKKQQEEQAAKESQKRLSLLKEKEERQYQKIEEEIQRCQEALREETRRRRSEAKQNLERNSVSEAAVPAHELPVSVTPIPKDTVQRLRMSVTPERQAAVAESGSYCKPERRRRNTSTPVRSDSESSADGGRCQDHRGVCLLTFSNKKERLIHRGQCLGHRMRGSTLYAGMDKETGELVTITEWIFQWRRPKRKLKLVNQEEDKLDAASYLKQVTSIESELMSLLRLHHSNLTHFLAFQHSHNNGTITVNVLSEYVDGGSLANTLRTHLPVPVEQLRHFTIQLIDVLTYLHGKAVVHKNLKASSVLLDKYGQVRLADYSLDHRLSELYAAVEARQPGVKFVEEKFLVPGRGGKKGDIYMLGLLLLSLAQGHDVMDYVPDVPTSLPQELHDFLNKCLMRDERARWSATQLQQHTFVKSPLFLAVRESPEKAVNSSKNQEQVEDEEDPTAVIPFIPTSDGGQSRLKSEFEILRWLGKGGFGDVIKVRNKLDGRFYAIKRIPLNPASKHFTRKITREVKLLSRLNHENVVRYYNSWIEISEEAAPSESMLSTQDTSSISPAQHIPSPAMAKVVTKNSLGLVDNIEMDIPVCNAENESIDWSISMSCSSRAVAAEDSSSSEDEDENDVFGVSFGASFLPESDSQDDSIVFDHGPKEDASQTEDSSNQSNSCQPAGKSSKSERTPEGHAVLKLQFLYIQMEFCEKSTLRNCIDVGLYQDEDRVWRLFREITEGLHHIHQQGMIHRDLKPVNIFLDSNDHVKIGDFGLATTDIITQTSIIDLNMTPTMNLDPRVNASKSESLGDGNLTGKVGTALYVSPEMTDTSTRTHYNQKVDIYSLGIMFFEMCYPPLPTGMERVKVLTALRQPSIIMPEDFDTQTDMHNQVEIICWMLNHDPASRPTAEQLLGSELLPPPQLEEAELTEVLRSTISQPDTKAYRHLISAVFSQRIDPATDFTFDIDLHKLQTSFMPGPLLVQKSVTESLQRVFSRHGALRLAMPLLMPKSTLYENCDQYVCMMDYSGGLVSLPYDLRVPFARYIARNNITSLKRYNIDKVYRQKRIYGLHPKELIECAFDIVTPTPASLVPDAELIYIINEVIADFPVLQERNYYLRLNHASLLKGVLLHCGVAEELHQEVFCILGDTRVGRLINVRPEVERQQKLQIQTRLGSLSLGDEAVMKLYHLIEMEDHYDKVASMMRSITKTWGLAGSYAKKGLHDMETIIGHAAAMGSKLQPILAVGLVYNMHYYNGVTFQVCAKLQRKSRTTMDVLAAGGRYDGLITKVLKPTSTSSHQGATPYAVGMSISYEKLLAARQEQQEWQPSGMVDVVVCSLGHKPLTHEKLGIAGELWSVGISAHIVYDFTQSLEAIQELGRHLGAAYTVVLKDLESGYARVRSVERDKVVEKKVQVNDLPNYLQQKINSKSDPPDGSSRGSKSSSQSNQGNTEPWNSSSSGGGSGGSSSSGSSTSSSLPPINITFIPSENVKMVLNTRRRHESQIYSSITSALSVLSKQCRVEVLAVELTSSVLKTIAGNLEIGNDESMFEESIGSIVEKHARHRKYLSKIFEEIHDLKYASNSKKTSVVVLYGLKDDSYRILI